MGLQKAKLVVGFETNVEERCNLVEGFVRVKRGEEDDDGDGGGGDEGFGYENEVAVMVSVIDRQELLERLFIRFETGKGSLPEVNCDDDEVKEDYGTVTIDDAKVKEDPKSVMVVDAEVKEDSETVRAEVEVNIV